MDEVACIVFDTLPELKKDIFKEVNMSIFHIAGHVIRKVDVEETIMMIHIIIARIWRLHYISRSRRTCNSNGYSLPVGSLQFYYVRNYQTQCVQGFTDASFPANF